MALNSAAHHPVAFCGVEDGRRRGRRWIDVNRYRELPGSVARLPTPLEARLRRRWRVLGGGRRERRVVEAEHSQASEQKEYRECEEKPREALWRRPHGVGAQRRRVHVVIM